MSDEPAEDAPEAEGEDPSQAAAEASAVEADDAPPAELEAAAPESEPVLSSVPDIPPPTSVPLPQAPAPLKVFPPPRVDEISPVAGTVLGDTRLTLTGANLFRESIVRVDGLIAQTIGADEPRELRVLTPPGKKDGPVDVTVENPRAEPAVLPKAFRYEPLPPPKIVSIAPDHVAPKGGTEVTIVGESFCKSTVVLLDGEPAEQVRFVDATTLDVIVPPGEDGQAVDVVVKNPDGKTDVARRAFMYDERFG